jgi:hypothetical protein
VSKNAQELGRKAMFESARRDRVRRGALERFAFLSGQNEPILGISRTTTECETGSSFYVQTGSG